MHSRLLVQEDVHVLTITLNRPESRNAIDAPLWDELATALKSAAGSNSVRAIVLTGAGGSFCSGTDLKLDRRDSHPLDRIRVPNEVAALLFDMPKPTIAKVRGSAVGGGLSLALACDLVIASTTARFSAIFTRRALSPDLGASWLLPHLVGLQQAKRLALLGDFVAADEALRLGLVTEVVEEDQLDATVQGLADRLAAGAPVALAQTKMLLNEATHQTFHEVLPNEARAQAVNFAGSDVKAAFEAFVGKREAQFSGRWSAAAPSVADPDQKS